MTVRVTREAEPQIELYGAYSGELLGGTQGTRSSLTFTPTDDYLIVVPKNQVNYAQLEEAPTPSSYILTTTSTATRAGETLTIPAANLPWPEPVVIGEELVTNGTFDTDISGWGVSNTSEPLSNPSQQLSVTGDGSSNYPYAYTQITLNIGSVYEVKADVVSGTSSIFVGSNQSTTSNRVVEKTSISSGATVMAYFVAPAETMYIRVGAFFDGSSGTYVFDNISVKEVNPLAVSIAMEGTVTYADTGESLSTTPTTGTVNFYSMSSDVNNYITGVLDTEATNLGVVRFLQEVNSVADLTPITEVYSPGVNVPFSVASRHGSTFINGAVDGTALTENTTPVALPDLSATDLNLGPNFMGTIKTFRIWADDISDVGIEEASS